MHSPYAARGIAAYEVRLALKVLRWFYEFGASRLAFRELPLPSKPVIPLKKKFFTRKLYHKYYNMQFRDKIVCLIGFHLYARLVIEA